MVEFSLVLYDHSLLGSTTRPENRIVPLSFSLMRKKKGRSALKVFEDGPVEALSKPTTAAVAAAASVPSSLTGKKFIKNVNQVRKEQTFELNTFNEGLLFYDGDRYMGLNHATEICFIREHIRNTNFLHRFC